MPPDDFGIRRLVTPRSPELHTVALLEALPLPVGEERQTRQRRQHTAGTEVAILATELRHRRLLVRRAEVVGEPAEELRIDLESVPQQPVQTHRVSVSQHMHEGAVVDTMQAEAPHEVRLHQPERLGQQQRVGRLGGDPVDHLAPELLRHPFYERLLAHAVLGA